MIRTSFAAMIIAALLASGTHAYALSGSVLLGFAETYVAAESAQRTHRGVDIAMSEGATVDAPASGVVRFVGRIPAVGGGTVLALSVECADGVVTFLPLEEARVTEGENVEVGADLGSVAAAGDASSAQTHLHLGLKHSGLYVDPAPLVGAAPAPLSEPEPEVQTQAQHDASPNHSPAAAPVHVADAVEPAPSPADAPQPTPAGSGVIAPRTAGAAEPAVAGTGELAPGVTLAGDVEAAAVVGQPAGVGIGHAIASSAGVLARSPEAGATFSRGAWAPAAALVAAALFSSALLVTRRALTRRVAVRGPMSDRLGILLQHLKAGDTLRGLTSCSGPLPSQSRGH